MTDELAPFFESRELRVNRLPDEARDKFSLAATAARESGQVDFEDRQFVSLWLSRRTGMPRTDILNNFDAIAGRFFGDGATATKAWDAIAAQYKQAGAGTAEGQGDGENARPGQAAGGKEEEYAETEGLARVGRGVFLENTEQSARSVGAGFEEVAQQVPAGLFSQMATMRQMPKSPYENRTYLDLDRERRAILRPPFWPYQHDKEPTPAEAKRLAKIDADMAVLLSRTNEENRKRLADLDGIPGLSAEFRKTAKFWYELSGDASKRWGVDPDFEKTTLGQFMKSAGSVPATAALAVMGPAGAVGLESMFFAQVEKERMEKEGDAYDPVKAFESNLASALPQMMLERAFGAERLLNKVLGEMPKQAGKVAFGDFMRQFVRQGLTAGVEEGLTEPAQNFWNDYIASLTYDQSRELFTPDALKQRAVESVSAFALGFLFGGGVTSLQAVDQNRKVAAGERYLTTKDGQTLAPEDFAVMRGVKSDQELMATAPDEETGRSLIAAVNGDKAAQAAYNNQVMQSLFVKTEEVDVAGMSVGQVNDVPVIRMEDGMIVPLDLTKEEDRAFLDNFKREAVKVKATQDTLAEMQKRHGNTLEASQPAKLATLEERVASGQMTQQQADEALAVAKEINGLAKELTLADVAPEGSATTRQAGDILKMVVEVAQSADPTKAIEEVSEAYIQRAYKTQGLVPADLNDARKRWHEQNGETDAAGAFEGEALERANIEWFSKRVIDYALANRKTELPGGWGAWLRTLGEQLKKLLKGATRMKKLLRDGKLDPELEAWMKGALGMTPEGDAFAGTADKAAARAEAGNREAAPVATELDQEMMDGALADESFPKIEKNDSGNDFLVSAPGGRFLGSRPDIEGAQNLALEWFDRNAREEEQAAAQADAGETATNELMRIVLKHGLPAPSVEPTFAGELRAIRENLGTAKALRIFRKNAGELDMIRQAVNEEGFAFETVTEFLDALDRSSRGEPVYGNKGGDEQVTFALAPKELVAVHNTSAEKLRQAADLGGFAVPSMAIIRSGVSRFTGFGDITLLAKPDMVDPRKDSTAKVFNADVYSPRFPTVRFKVDGKALDAAWKRLGEESKAMGNVLSTELDSDEIEKNGLKEFEDAATVKMAFLKSKGIAPDVRMREVEKVPAALLKFEGSRWALTDDPEFQKAVADHLRKELKGYPDVLADMLDEDGKVLAGPLSRMAERVVLTKKPEVDRYATNRALEDQIEKAGLKKEFAEWVRDQFSQVIKGRAVRDYNERTDTVRFLPYDLDTVVRVMKRELRDGEGFNYGVGSIRSNVAKQFRSLKEISADSRAIVAPDVMEQLKKEVDDEFMRLADELRPFYKFDTKRFGYLDEVSTAFKELALFRGRKWGEMFNDTPADLMKRVGEFMTKLGTMPTEYFEAKVQRGVKLNEFVAAVIPNDTPEDVRELLTTQGLKLVEYPKSDEKARAAALDTFAQDEDLTFALTGVPQNSTQALQAQASALRAKKLAATAALQARLRSGTPLPKRAALVRRTTQASLAARLAMPISSRLARIDRGLAQGLRWFEFGLGNAIAKDFAQVEEFIRGFEKMRPDDAAVLDLALKNGDTDTRDTLLAAYNLTAAFAKVEAVFEATKAKARAAGYEFGDVADYFPRKVNDVDGLFMHYYGKPQGGRIEEVLKEAAQKAAAQGRTLTHEERVEIVNSVLRGFRPPESKPSNLKARKTDVVDVDADRFYADSIQALVSYIESLNAAIEKRRFFGKFAVSMQAPNGGVFLSNKLAVEASIGALVEDMIASGQITRAQQAEVTAVLEARFNQQASSPFIRAFKSLSYMGTMGQITSAMTQLTDLAFSMYENGVFDTLAAAGQAVTRTSKITRKQLGLETMAEEFREMGKLQKAVDRVFKLVGIHYLDMVGKETLVNAKFRQLQREAAAGKLSVKSRALINASFGPTVAPRVIGDLAAGRKNEDTLFAVYSVLADYQPISLSEYPEFYLRHPNGRVFYMLKSFMLKQIDSFRRESISLIVRGNAKQKATGFKNLIHLAGLLYIVGLPVDWLKDWIMGRDPQLGDLAVDNVFKLLGVNRWNIWQFRERKNPLEAAMLLVTPPAPFLQYPLLDAGNVAKKIAEGEDIEPGNFESWRMLPFIGSPIYWWFGGGAVKVEKRKRERERGRVTP
jgi:hypothetical protein